MVLELPPAPAALVLLGRRLAVFSARSAAAFLRMTVAGPPGGFGDAGRAVVVPEEAAFEGEVARWADYDTLSVVIWYALDSRLGTCRRARVSRAIGRTGNTVWYSKP